ncbi:uncharacterized protein LOC132904272 [Amyelois transitella]|uniref:uncharacterized protein LOC132904272 n=1 Tax=Amyelois transitella TaxID=680683 RepID=UPI00298F6BE0|nr:uncharacterized protein LOC132904272 [Amyelois transitella]
MKNYTEYKIMGSVKQIRMKPNCIPSRFDCQADRKHKSTPSEPRQPFIKRQRMSTIMEIEENTISIPSCSQDTPEIIKYIDKAVQVVQAVEHKAIQACRMIHYRSKNVQTAIKNKDSMTSPLKSTVCTATSPFKVSQVGSTSKVNISILSATKRKLNFEGKYESDDSYTPSITGMTTDCDSSPYKISKTTSDTSSQEEFKKVEKLNLLSTLSKIKSKLRLYIGLPKELHFLLELIEKHANISEQNILLCLMRIKLNRTFSQLADDFDISVTHASNVFFKTLPEIVKVLLPFIKQFSTDTIKMNLPIAFRHKYNKVTCIIDC